MADKFVPKRDDLSAPFNLALATLEKMHNILKLISLASSGYSHDEDGNLTGMSAGEAQHLKVKLVKQLFIQSIPLFDKNTNEWQDKMLNRIRTIKPLFRTRYTFNGHKSIPSGIIEIYSQVIDDELDDITIEIQRELQQERYFMPSKADPRFSWGEK